MVLRVTLWTVFLPLERQLGHLDCPFLGLGHVSREDDAMGFEGGVEIRERNIFIFSQTVHEGLELWKVRMMRDVSRIDQIGFQLAPTVLGHFQFITVDAIVEQTPFAAHEMNVKIIRLETIRLPKRLSPLAILEFQ